ncbi:MAG: 16S rRNA (guanine(527)-N(7))-methyltransferase RsmG [Trichloromonadaceae bacterium]
MAATTELHALLKGQGLSFSPATETALEVFLAELLRWNQKINLTSIIDPQEAREKHLLDSLSLLPLLQGSERLLDVGSGGGFPGIPLKLALPGLEVLSIDAVQKKIAFQRHVARLLGLQGFSAEHLRVEQVPPHPLAAGGFAVVVSRAFAALEQFASLALPCLAPDGRIVAMKGAEAEKELQQSSAVLARLGLRCSNLQSLRLPISGAQRSLIVLTRC